MKRDLNPILEIAKAKVPAFFLHGTEDKIIPPSHSEDLYEAYPGEKELILFESGHNEARSNDVYEAVRKLNGFNLDIFFGNIVQSQHFDDHFNKICP